MNLCYKQISLVCLMLMLTLLFNGGSAFANSVDLSVDARQLVAKQRVGRSFINYTYTVTVSNSGAAKQNVVATVTSLSPNTVIVENTLVLGSLAAGATIQSIDTFTLRQNRRVLFNPDDLIYTFSYNLPSNTPPVADAGADQSLTIGSTAQLDGSASSDAEGNPLTFRWSLMAAPNGSGAMLSDQLIINPTLFIDLPGDYTINLVVDDGIESSLADSVTISTENTPPVADAGTDQSVFVGNTAMLDGSGSSDIDGDALTFSWSLTDIPAGSSAALTDPTAIMPRFDVDTSGSYTAELLVNDMTIDSLPDTVTITTENSAPIAHAGPDQAPLVGETVTLDGSLSSDADGDNLTFSWSLTSIPADSSTLLSDPATVASSFPIDAPGEYVGQLIVNDGSVDSLPDTVIVTTENTQPTANAGPDQQVQVGSTVTLDGSLSDDADGDEISYAWSITTKPPGSLAEISDPAAANPNFIADLPGMYIVQLVINDGQVDSDPDTAVIDTENRAPTAVATASANTVPVNTSVQLNGSASSDPDGDAISYQWSLSRPVGSSASLTATTSANPSFTPDVPGAYEATLIVNDQKFNSAPSSVSVTATNTNNPPDLIPVGNRTITADQTFDSHLFAIDPDAGDTLAFSLMTAPAGMTIDSGAGTLSWTPNAANLGIHNIEAKVTDGGGLSDSEAFTIEVVQALPRPSQNNPPQLDPIADQTLTIGDMLALTASASDIDTEDMLTFSLPLAPAGMTINVITGVIDWVPDTNQSGTHDFTVQVTDTSGAIAVQSAIVTVNPVDRPPVASDDIYTARIGETLTVAAPGILQNDTDPDGDALTVQLVNDGTTGTLNLNTDGSFDYLASTPLATTEAVPVSGDLVQLVTPIRVEVSSSGTDHPRSRAVDGDLDTSWFTEDGDAANLGGTPTIELIFPQDVSVTELQIFGNRETPDGLDILEGVFQLFDRSGAELFNSGTVSLPAPDRDFTVAVPSIDAARSVRFTVTSDESLSVGFSELKVIGSAVTRTMKRRSNVELTRFGPAEVEASSSENVNYEAPFAIDQSDFTHWRASVDDPAPQYDIKFPGQSATVSELRLSGPRNRFSSVIVGWSYATCRFVLLDKADAELWDSGVIPCFSDAARNLVLPVPDIENVSTVRFLGLTREDDRFGAGFAEIKVFGEGAIWPIYPKVEWSWSEASSGPLSSDALFGNVSNTPISIDLDGDGFMELIFGASRSADFFSTIVGNIVVLDGRTGEEKLILADPDTRINASTSMAAGDIDGDGRPEIIAVAEVLSTWHLICFEDDFTVKWRSDPIEPLSWGGIAIANIDASGLPEILVGRQVLNADGELVWTGERGAATSLPIAADIDLDGLAEVIVGSTVYRSDGTLFWDVFGSRSGATGNFDDDAFAELVFSTSTGVRLFEHDGTLIWETLVGDTGAGAPTVADFDGDGKPEVGVLFARNYIVLETDGSILWKRPIFDGSARTGSSVIDLDGDGSAEVIQRDETHFRIYRGIDGELLFLTTMSSSTADEGPMVADIDSDGHAEIISVATASTRVGSVPATKGIVVFGGFDEDWVRTRKIWNQHSYHVTNVNEDGTIPVVERNNWLTPGLNNYRQNAYSPDDLDRFESFSYKAVAAGKDSNVAKVFLDALAPNAAPVITSLPDTSATVGFEYLYAVSASDADLDPLLFSLVEGPSGMTIDPPTGLLRWSPELADVGETFVTIRVADSGGMNATQRYKLTTSESVLVPDVTGQTRPEAGVTLGAASLNEGVVRFTDDPVVTVGSVISQSPPAGSVAEFDGNVDLFISIGPGPADVDNDGDGFTENLGDCNDADDTIFPGATDVLDDGIDQNCDGSDATVPPVRIVVSPESSIVLTGEVVTLKAIGVNDDGTSRNLSGLVSWSAGPEFSSESAGIFTVTASLEGVSGEASITVVNRVSGDAIPPVVVIASPGDGSAIDRLVDITGSATDENFLRYELYVSPVGRNEFVQIAGGSTPIEDGLLGQFDPGTLPNGLYTLRLTVFDRGGTRFNSQIDVSLEGGAKPGNFSLMFTDLYIPSGSVPLQLDRTYDSIDKTKGDFGIGWTLGVKSIKVSCNPLGENWFVAKGGLAFALLPTRVHDCSVILPSGLVERFAFKPSQDSSFIVPFIFLRGEFEPYPGVRGTLQSLDNTNFLIADPQPGDVSLLDDLSLEPFAPQRFLYTAQNGFQFEIGPDGLETMTDNNGNKLTFSESAITHSTGTTIALDRDAEGRITKITDPRGNSQSYNYSPEGDLIQHVDAEGNTTRMFYDMNHLLVRIEDPLGHAGIRNEYDDDGRRTATVDADGNRTEFDYDLVAETVTITDPNGVQTIIEYDPDGNVTQNQSTVSIDGVPTVVTKIFEYDDKGNETLVVDADGVRVEREFTNDRVSRIVIDPAGLNLEITNIYDGDDNLIQTSDAYGDVRTLTNDSHGNPLTIDGPGDVNVGFEYTGDGQFREISDPLGNRTSLTYTTAGQVSSKEIYSVSGDLMSRTESDYDGNGNVVETREIDITGTNLPRINRFTYDASDRLVSHVDPAGDIRSWEYDANGNLVATIDANGDRTEMVYNARGLMTKKIFPDTSTLILEYDAVGNMIRKVDGEGTVTEAIYDELGRSVGTSINGVIRERKILSPAGRTEAVVDAQGQRTDFLRDTAGRIIGIQQPEVRDETTGSLVRPLKQREVDALGRLTATVDPNGDRTEYIYDENGRLSEIVAPDGNSLSQQVDAAGRPLSSTNALGQTTEYGYDPLGRLVWVLRPEPRPGAARSLSRYIYDSQNHLQSEIDALGRKTDFEYDAKGQLTKRILPGGSNLQLEYNPAGQVIRTTDSDGTVVNLTYDGLGRIVRRDTPGGATESVTYNLAGQRATVSDARGTTVYEYYPDGSLQSITESDGGKIAYVYDDNKRVKQLKANSNQIDYSYDANGRLNTVTDISGITSYFYDAAGNPVRVAMSNGLSVNAVFDSIGRAIQLIHKDANGVVLATYDAAYNADGSRSSVTELDGSQELYQYDSLGRLVAVERTGTDPYSVEYEYDLVGNRVRTVFNGVETLSGYDANNQLVYHGNDTYTYDSRGNRISSLVDGEVLSYSWDAFDRLIRIASSNTSVEYQYDLDGKRISETIDGLTTRFLVDQRNPSGLNQIVHERNEAGEQLASYTYGLGLLNQQRGSGSWFYSADIRGDVRMLSDANSAVTDRYTFMPYGQTLSRTGTSTNAYAFTGQRRNALGSSYDFRARSYDSGGGVFLSRDQYFGDHRDPMSMHAYQYANADPINNWDPLGYQSVSLAETSFVSQMTAFLQKAWASTKAFRIACKVKSVVDYANKIHAVTQLAFAGFSGLLEIKGATGVSGSITDKISFEIPFGTGKDAYNDKFVVEIDPNIATKETSIKLEIDKNGGKDKQNLALTLGPGGVSGSAGLGTDFEIDEITACGQKVGAVAFGVELQSGIGAKKISPKGGWSATGAGSLSGSLKVGFENPGAKTSVGDVGKVNLSELSWKALELAFDSGKGVNGYIFGFNF